MAIRLTIWNEFVHEQRNEKVRAIYPSGMHGALAEHLASPDLIIRTATLDQPEHGLTDEVLAETDVLTWWGHTAHHHVSDEVVARVIERVHQGMGLIVLHSGHASKIFKKLMGTPTNCLSWREDNEKERLWVTAPGHPIAAGLGEHFDIPADETYAEPFGIPQPETLVFITWYPGGEVFRSGCCYTRGAGRVFYFQPGHETFPVYHQPEVIRVIGNAVRWAAPSRPPYAYISTHIQRLEP